MTHLEVSRGGASRSGQRNGSMAGPLSFNFCVARGTGGGAALLTGGFCAVGCATGFAHHAAVWSGRSAAVCALVAAAVGKPAARRKTHIFYICTFLFSLP